MQENQQNQLIQAAGVTYGILSFLGFIMFISLFTEAGLFSGHGYGFLGNLTAIFNLLLIMFVTGYSAIYAYGIFLRKPVWSALPGFLVIFYIIALATLYEFYWILIFDTSFILDNPLIGTIITFAMAIGTQVILTIIITKDPELSI